MSTNPTTNFEQTNGEEMLNKLFNDVIGIVNSHIGQSNQVIGTIDNGDHSR